MNVSQQTWKPKDIVLKVIEAESDLLLKGEIFPFTQEINHNTETVVEVKF